MSDRRLAVQPVDGWHNVYSAVSFGRSRQGLLAARNVAGVVDRDARSDTEIANLSRQGVAVLKYNEVESYFAHPDVVVRWAEEGSVTKEQVADRIGTVADKWKEFEASRRVLRRLQSRHDIGISLGRDEYSAWPPDERSAKIHEKLDAAVREVHNEVGALTTEAVQQMFDQEVAAILSAIRNRDVETILALISGSVLLKEVHGLTSVRPMSRYIRHVMRQSSPGDYGDVFVAVRSEISRTFDAGHDGPA